MKKSLLAVAIAALVPGAVMAQTNVTLFGVADVGLTQRKGDGNGSVTGMGNSLFSSARFGVRGVEDLGGGLRAGFWLEAGVNIDDASGQATSTNNQVTNGGTGLSFNRRSTASLMGGFGEVRLGRDYVPSFWNHTIFDPFGTLGIGAATASTARILGVTAVRASNSVGYFLPGGLGGLYGQVMYAFGENATVLATGAPNPNKDDGRYLGGRIGFASGPFDIAASTGTTKFAAGDITNTNIAGAFTFGPAKLMAQFNTQENKGNAVPTATNVLISAATPTAGALVGRKQSDILVGATYTMGATTLRGSYIRSDVKDTGSDAVRLTIGVSQALSKRTNLYAAYGVMDNKTGGNLFSNGRLSATAGGKTTGFDLGVAHSF